MFKNVMGEKLNTRKVSANKGVSDANITKNIK